MIDDRKQPKDVGEDFLMRVKDTETQHLDAIMYSLVKIVSPGEYLPKMDKTPFHYFAQTGMEFAINLCLKLGVDVNLLTP